MECPACHEDVTAEASECPWCGLALDPEPGGPSPDPDIELTTVLRTGDAGLIALVKSLLEAESIEYFVQSERAQDLFGFGRAGTNYNVITGPAEFVVRAEDAARARALLAGLGNTPAPDGST
jgi:hypothetical protein